jgi:hypothetical protein
MTIRRLNNKIEIKVNVSLSRKDFPALLLHKFVLQQEVPVAPVDVVVMGTYAQLTSHDPTMFTPFVVSNL